MVDSKLLFEHGIANYNSPSGYNNNSPQPSGVIHSPDIKFESDIWNIAEELVELLIKKHKDYGPTNISRSPGGPLNGLRVRMWDKVARINNLIDNDATPENESLKDSFVDIANYAIIALLVLEGKWPEK